MGWGVYPALKDRVTDARIHQLPCASAPGILTINIFNKLFVFLHHHLSF